MTINSESGKSRFEALLAGSGLAAHDRPLLECNDWLVAPTLGAIVPNWILVIPRRPTLSFRDWARIEGVNPVGVLAEVRGHLGLKPHEVIWFEHGPAEAGTLAGCGLDHAHIHILVRPRFSFCAFVECARAQCDLDWQEEIAHLSYATIEHGTSYCIAGCGDRVVVASQVQRAGSQFFRRVVSKLCGKSEEWDYRHFSHRENIAETINTFRSLEGATRRES